MISCHFARLLGERKLKISDVARDTGINRGTLTRLYYETAERVELEVLDQLCDYFGIDLPELLVRSPGKHVKTPLPD
ncbi:MAG: helix-turn-helix transcriptional regulator [Actinomycetales bacterium]|nr:helix-turn-helix transcriptional regulator [Actinomycetales bacterium]